MSRSCLTHDQTHLRPIDVSMANAIMQTCIREEINVLAVALRSQPAWCLKGGLEWDRIHV